MLLLTIPSKIEVLRGRIKAWWSRGKRVVEVGRVANAFVAPEENAILT